MRAILPVGFCVVFCAMAGAANAATVEIINGPVSLNTGLGFKSIRGSAVAGGGDIVMAGAAGKAEITYSDGCKQTVAPGETVTISEESPCKLGALGADPMEGLVVGGLAAAAVIGVISNVSNDNNASP